MYVYVWEQKVSLYHRTAWWILINLGMDEVRVVLHMCKGILSRFTGKKITHGVPFLNKLLQQQTECILMIWKDVGRSVVIFGSIPKSDFCCVFDVFNAISIDFMP